MPSNPQPQALRISSIFVYMCTQSLYSKNLAIFQTSDGALQLNVKLERDTVWLNANQMATLFDRDSKTIRKHIKNALQEELAVDPHEDNPTVAKFATVQAEGSRQVVREVEHYNLDVVLSVGYRVKSLRGIEFRRWANKVLKDYIIKGVAVNDERLKRLGQMVEIMRRAEKQLEASEVSPLLNGKHSVKLARRA